MRVLVTGSTGFIGRSLAAALDAEGHQVAAGTRRPGRYCGPGAAVAFDSADAATVDVSLRDCDLAYYLVHALAEVGDFAKQERRAAEVFGMAARRHGTKVVYLGGLGDDRPEARRSAHLRSRHEVGQVLRARADTVELQAAIVIGNGSAAFDMVRWSVKRLPVMLVPSWVTTRIQPIALTDMVRYLLAAADLPPRCYQVGGADVVTYQRMITRCAELTGRRCLIVKAPVVAPGLTAAAIRASTEAALRLPRPPALVPGPVRTLSLALRLAEGMSVEVVVNDDRIRQLVPFSPMGFDDAVRRAVEAE